MSDIASFRLANTEGRRRARMKARTELWWHQTHCANCRAKLATFSEALSEALDIAVGSPRLVADQDPKKLN